MSSSRELSPDTSGVSRTKAQPAWAAMCMCCDPFAGDYGGSGSGDGVLSDKIVRAKVQSECHTCAGLNERRDWVRVRAEVFDGEFMRFRWCEACCVAMADVENPDAYEARVSIGQGRRAAPASPESRPIQTLDDPIPPSTQPDGDDR